MSKFWQLEAWAKTVAIKVDRWSDDSIDDIRFSAIENAREQRDLYRNRQNLSIDADTDSEPADEERSIVAFLRHNATNYDEILTEMRGRIDFIEWYDGDDDPTEDDIDAYLKASQTVYETIRGRVHTALKAAYPELADEIAEADSLSL